MSPKPKPKSPPASKARAAGGKQAAASGSGPASRREARARAAAATKPRFPVAWVVSGAVLVTVVAIAVISGMSGGSSSPGGGSATPASAELVHNTKLADVPLLTAEGVATHIHTSLVVTVDGKEKEVPAGIGIDAQSGHIAALHTHDTSGLIHLESAKENDDYTLEQFLTVWGMPKDAPGRCAFFGATSPCTLTVTSKDSGKVPLDVPLKDYDTLTLTVTSG